MLKKSIMIGISLLSISLVACSNSQSEKDSVLMEQEVIKEDNQQKKVITTMVIENTDAVYVGQKDNNTVEIIVDGEIKTSYLTKIKKA